MATVYIETTIPSYYHESRSGIRISAWHESTRRWWDELRSGYQLVTSDVVIRELERAPAQKAEQMLAMMKNIPRLARAAGVQEAARLYMDHGVMPRTSAADALHVALASIHGIDFLLTWNCRHLANANKTRHLSILNGRLGLPLPIITTPDLLVPEDDP